MIPTKPQPNEPKATKLQSPKFRGCLLADFDKGCSEFVVDPSFTQHPENLSPS